MDALWPDYVVASEATADRQSMAVAWVDYSKAIVSPDQSGLKSNWCPASNQAIPEKKQWRSKFTVKRNGGMESTMIQSLNGPPLLGASTATRAVQSKP